MKELDTAFVRAQFPAFLQPSLEGHAFFENAGGSYTCGQVIDRLNRFYTERKVQPYGVFRASQDGGNEMDEARTRLSALISPCLMVGLGSSNLPIGRLSAGSARMILVASLRWRGK